MSNGWTLERRARQAQAIRRWKPWERSSGPQSEAGKAKSESPELPLGDGILRFEDPEEKDQTDQTDQTDRTDQTDAPAKGTGPSKEAIKAKFNELLFEELAAHVLPAKDLWLAYLSDVLRQVSVAALKLAE